MCYSPETSIGSFLVGITFSFLLTRRPSTDDQIVGYFLGFVSLMQGIEYLLWNHQNCDPYNRAVSQAGILLNHLQPVVLGALILLLSPVKNHRIPIVIITAFYAFAAAVYSQKFFNVDVPCTQRDEKDPHLFWKWNWQEGAAQLYGLFLAILTLFPMIGFMDKTYGFLIGLTSFSTFALSSYLYDRKFVGAMWCFFAALSPVLIFFFRAVL